MKVLVFGATGGTGNLVVQQALENGFEVTYPLHQPLIVTVKLPPHLCVYGK